jgi:hypothetical protein
MSDIIQALLNAVETREIDLGECAEMYAGVKIPIRVNWTRGHKRRYSELAQENDAIQDEYKAASENENSDIASLNRRGEENATSWLEWWAVALLMTLDEVSALKDALPPPHWEWLKNRIVKTIRKYEADETKKVLASLGRSSEEPEPSPPTSGTDSSSQDG